MDTLLVCPRKGMVMVLQRRLLGVGVLWVLSSCAEATSSQDGLTGGAGQSGADASPATASDADPQASCVCDIGACCDGCQLLPSTEPCGTTPIDTEYRCEDTSCGADAQYREQLQYCNGVSTECGNDNIVWGNWQVLEECADDALCSSDGTNASCSTCATGCAGDSCICSQGANVAPTAIASLNSGSTSATYGPVRMNDGEMEDSCGFAWFHDRDPQVGSIELEWSTPQVLWGIHLDTVSSTDAPCAFTSNRTLASGSIEWWDGTDWVVDGVETGHINDWTYEFSAPIQTTKIRIHEALGVPQENPVVFEWQAFSCSP